MLLQRQTWLYSKEYFKSRSCAKVGGLIINSRNDQSRSTRLSFVHNFCGWKGLKSANDRVHRFWIMTVLASFAASKFFLLFSWEMSPTGIGPLSRWDTHLSPTRRLLVVLEPVLKFHNVLQVLHSLLFPVLSDDLPWDMRNAQKLFAGWISLPVQNSGHEWPKF